MTECVECGLVFKDPIPSAKFLTLVFEEQAGARWNVAFSYEREKALIEDLVGPSGWSLLDVGPGRGDLVALMRDQASRVGALDIVKHPGLEEAGCSEFSHGLIDQEGIVAPGTCYSVVTAFDVLEHVYDGDRAFRNLAAFCGTKGYVIIETGDVASVLASGKGAGDWWYASLFEHHVFWRRETIESIAAKHGLELVSCDRVRHKSWEDAGAFKVLFQWVKARAYGCAPILYLNLATRLGKQGAPQADPLVRDHLRAVLRKRNLQGEG